MNDIIAALRGENWPAVPTKFEMSRATLLAIKEWSADRPPTYGFLAPALGTPVYVDESVPHGQARATFSDGRVELVGKVSDGRTV